MWKTDYQELSCIVTYHVDCIVPERTVVALIMSLGPQLRPPPLCSTQCE